MQQFDDSPDDEARCYFMYTYMTIELHSTFYHYNLTLLLRYTGSRSYTYNTQFRINFRAYPTTVDILR